MPLPSTVTGSWSDWLNADHGPYYNGSNIYVFTVDKTNNKVRVYKSGDGGLTWTEQDSANAPAINSTATFKTIATAQSGTSLYVCYVQTVNTQHVRVSPFDMSTDTWGTATAVDFTTDSNAISITGQFAMVLMVRSDGSYVVFFQSNTENVMGTSRRRFAYRIYSSGAWGASVQFGTGVTDHYDLRASVLGVSDRVHFFYTKAASTSSIFHRSLSSTNVLDTEATAATATSAGTVNYCVGVPVAFVNGANTEVAVGYADGSTNFRMVHFNSAANPASFGNESVSASGVEAATSNPAAMAVIGTTKYAFLVDATSDDIYRDSDAGSNTWGTDVAQEATITCQGVNVSPVSSTDIGILFNDNGTVKYDKYATSTGATYTDSGTEVLAFTPSATENAQFVDASTGGLLLTPSGLDDYHQTVSTDSGTAVLALTPSATENAQFVDAATESLLLTPSATENTQFVDASTETLVLVPSAADTAQYVDSNTDTLLLTPSSAEEYTTFDATTTSLLLSPSGTDEYTPGAVIYTDSGTEVLTLTPSADDTAQYVDSDTALLLLSPTATDAVQYTDSNTESLSLVPSSSDAAEYVDSGTELFVLTPFADDTAQYVDSDIELFSLVPSSTETAEYVDAATDLLLLVPSSADILESVDSDTVLLALTPSVAEILKYLMRPVSDVSGGWTDQNGGTTNLFDAINELAPDTSDYIQSSLSPASSEVEIIRLENVGLPYIQDDYIIRFEYDKDQAGGDTLNLTVSLLLSDATTVVKSQTFTDVQNGPIEGSIALTQAEAASISSSDFANGLCLSFEAVKV